MGENVIETKSFKFAIRVVNLYQYLTENKKEYILSKQLLRSGTSIGANVTESQNAQSNLDFINKMSIALKETSETKYWLRLLKETGYLTEEESKSMLNDCMEIESILVKIIKTSKEKINQKIYFYNQVRRTSEIFNFQFSIFNSKTVGFLMQLI